MDINLKEDGYDYDYLVKVYNQTKSILDEGPQYKEIVKEQYTHVVLDESTRYGIHELIKEMNRLGLEGYKAEGGITKYYDGNVDRVLQVMVKKVVSVEQEEISPWSRLTDTQSSVYDLETIILDEWVEKGYVDKDDELVFMDDDNNLLTKKGLFEVEDDYEEDWGFDD
jgi:hypothetical protein